MLTIVIDDEADNASLNQMTSKEFSEWDAAINLKDEEEEDLSDSETETLRIARENALKLAKKQ